MSPGFPYVEGYGRYWSAENSELVDELPLYDEIIGVWCAKSARREILTVSGQELHRVNSVFRCCAECIRSGGQHFQQLLQHL
jgi:hypothetical protein